ncbi:GNAT family N-acetyltransferase [Streptomyces sp. NPDC097619]|uniref:GNAT family N-acetyltransferase n=1 Tax=Streptomyces sp. NPDC097619 TaxID=3157228 RepID=UPI00331EB085
MELRREVPAGGEARVAALYWEAFGRKLGGALGPAPRGRAFLAAHMHRDRAVTALVDGRVVGVAGFKIGGRGLSSARTADVLRAYGPLRGLVRLPLLALLERRTAPRRLDLDGLAVDPALRGRGIGTRLLDEVGALAAEHGCDHVRLDVIDGNPRARALYAREGFTVVRTTRTPWLERPLGIGGFATMQRPAGPARRASHGAVTGA